MPITKVRGPKRDEPLLDITESQFQALSDQKAVELLRVQSQIFVLKARHALWGLILGAFSYVASLGAFVYLAMEGHPKLAAAALSTSVLSVIKRILSSRA
jgi:hypothetical protein